MRSAAGLGTAIELSSALIVFLALDAVIFHGGLYASILAPLSYAGQVQLVVAAERDRPTTTRPQVLVLGDSRIAEGFSAKLADTAPDASFTFINGSVPGSTLRTEYYLLRELDKDANRYAAIVVPLDDYDDLAGPEDQANRELDLAFTSSLLNYQDVLDYPWTFGTPRNRLDAVLGTLLGSYAFRLDVQDLVADPAKRVSDVRLYRAVGASSRYEYPGRSGSLAGLRYDATSDSYVFPEGLAQEQRDQLAADLAARRAQPVPSTAYREYWLGRILARYQNSQTVFFIVQVPRGPAPPPVVRPESFETIDWLASVQRVHVVPRDAFVALERPDLFFDALHLNAEGRQLFTQSVSRVVTEASTGGSGRGNDVVVPSGWQAAPQGGWSLDLEATGAGAASASGIYPRDAGLNFVEPDFSFALPAAQTSGRIKVDGYLPPPFESILPLHISIDAGAAQAQTTTLTAPGPFTLEIPIDAATSSERLIFHVDRSLVPRAIGLNQDERALSIGLLGVDFAPRAPEP